MRGYNILDTSCRFLALLFFLFPMLIFAWTDPVNISNTEGRSKYPAMCQDERGWLHVVFEDNTQDENDIYYVYYNGLVWSDTLNVSHDSTTSWRPDVAVDTLNRVHIVWGNSYTGRIMWTMYDTGGWSTPVSISDSVPYACQGQELDVSPLTNNVHCVWHNLGDAEIWHAYYNGSVWSIPENVTQDSNDDAWVDVAVDLLGRVHLVWMDYGSGSMDSIEIFYSRFDSISWTPPVNASRTVGASVDPRITTDNDNNPRVVWEERKNGYSVYYTYFDGVDWVNPVLVDTDASCVPDISVDEENRAHIVWYHGNGASDIFYTVYNDTTQEFPPENASNTDSISLGPSVVTDSEYVHLVWGEAYGSSSSDNIEIYYSRRKLSGISDKEKREISFSLPSIVIKKLSFCFSLPEPSSVYISFYDLAGKKVKEASLCFKNKGTHHCSLSLDLPSGIYFAVMKAGSQTYRGKFILLTPNKGGV